MTAIIDPGEAVSEAVWHRPPAPLLPFVAWYTGYRDAGLPPALHRGLPSPYLTFILTLDDPLVIAEHPDPLRNRPAAYDTLVGGLHTRPALISHDGSQSGVQLAVTPLGARALFDLPAGELVMTDLDAADLLGPVADLLRERLLYVHDWQERFAVLDSELLARARPDRAGRPGRDARLERYGMAAEVAHVWSRLLDTGGAAPIAEVAAETGWSRRHLGDRFAAEIGLRPKEAARVVRFDRARRILQADAGSGPNPDAEGGPGRNLAELAAICGYYDQAHLAREFVRLAGCPPSRLRVQEFPNVQATDRPGERD